MHSKTSDDSEVQISDLESSSTEVSNEVLRTRFLRTAYCPSRERPRTNKTLIATSIYEFFMQGKKDSTITINGYYKSNEEIFKGKFSRFTLSRDWKKYKVKELYDSIPEGTNMTQYKEQVITLLSPYLDFMKSSNNVLPVMQRLSQEERQRIWVLNAHKRYLTPTEEDHIAQVCTKFSDFGYPVTRCGLKEIIDTCIQKKMINISSQSFSGVPIRYVDNFIRRHNDVGKLISASSLDPQRSEQVTEEVRDALFSKLDIYTKLLKSMGVFDESINSFGDISDTQKYNIDETALNTTKRAKRKIFGSKKKKKQFRKQMQKKQEQSQNWKITPEGDNKMNRHVSIVVCSRADGAYYVPGDNDETYGAIPPFVIHKQTTVKRKLAEEKNLDDVLKEDVDTAYSAGLFVEDSDGNESNHYGFGIRTTPKGSMQQDIFLDYAVHFVKNLPADQGKGKNPAILIMDGHKSRWTLNALEYLTENNVWSFFLPSHTSIITQPNDGGINKGFLLCVSEESDRNSNAIKACSVPELNVIFLGAWKKYIERENHKLLHTGDNDATVAWTNCGYAPFNKHCISWESELNKKKECQALLEQVCDDDKEESSSKFPMYEVVPRHTECKLLDISIESLEKETIFYTGYENYKGGRGDIMRVSYLRAKRMLSRWKEGGDINMKPEDYCLTVGDEIAMRHMQFVRTSEYEIEYNIEDYLNRDVKRNLRTHIEKYLSGMEAICEYCKITYKVDDESVKGVIQKRDDDVYRIELKNGSVFDDLSLKDILDDSKINVTIMEKKMESELKCLANIKEMINEEKAVAVGKNRYQSMLLDEYQAICKLIANRDVSGFTFSDFMSMRSRISSPFNTVVNKRNVTVEPSEVGCEYGKISSTGKIVADSLKEIMCCLKQQEKLSDARVKAEGMKKRATPNKRKNEELGKKTDTKKLKVGDKEDTDDKQKVPSHVVVCNDALDHEPEEELKKMAKTPKTKYGEDAIVVENHVRYVSKCNTKFDQNEELNKLMKSLPKKEMHVQAFNELMERNVNWYDWQVLDEGKKSDNDDFKILARIVAPTAGIIGKDMRLKKEYFADKNITKLRILSAFEDLKVEVQNMKVRIEELKEVLQ